MAIPAIANAEYPTPQEMLSGLLSEFRYGYERISVAVNVAAGTEPYIRYLAVANRLSIAIQNNKLALADISPLDAAGDALEEICGVYGISRRAASSAAGLLVITTVPVTAIVTIPTAFQCTAPNGIQYRTTAANTVTTGDTVEVQAVTAGLDTEQVAGVIMTWDSAAIAQLGQNATVSSGGIDGGAEADTDEVLRQRLIRRLSFPQVGGNAAQTTSFAEDATSAVEAAFVYPAARGPGSYDVAVTGAGGDRALSAVHIGTATSAILGNMPGNADLNCTTVAEQLVDVMMTATLPLPVNAGGAGGGWRDAAPWPSSIDTDALTFCRVTNYVNGQFTVNSILDPPVMGKRFGVWNPLDSTMYEYTIATNPAGAPGAFTFYVSGDAHSWLGNINPAVVFRYVSAGAVNLKLYAAAFLAAMEGLGPGEKTASLDILPRGRRNPPPDVSWPMDLNTRLMSSIFAEYGEVSNLTYVMRRDAHLASTRTAPSVPATTADAPRILTLNSVAFVAQVT